MDISKNFHFQQLTLEAKSGRTLIGTTNDLMEMGRRIRANQGDFKFLDHGALLITKSVKL